MFHLQNETSLTPLILTARQIHNRKLRKFKNRKKIRITHNSITQREQLVELYICVCLFVGPLSLFNLVLFLFPQ